MSETTNRDKYHNDVRNRPTHNVVVSHKKHDGKYSGRIVGGGWFDKEKNTMYIKLEPGIAISGDVYGDVKIRCFPRDENYKKKDEDFDDESITFPE